MRSRPGRALAIILGVVVLAGVGLIAQQERSHRTFRVGSDSYPCSERLNTAFVQVNVFGTRTATFFVDGRQVPGAYSPPDLTPYAGMAGVPPQWRCDDGGEHRYEIVTDRPEGCRITAVRVYTNTERPDVDERYDALGACSVTIVD